MDLLGMFSKNSIFFTDHWTRLNYVLNVLINQKKLGALSISFQVFWKLLGHTFSHLVVKLFLDMLAFALKKKRDGAYFIFYRLEIPKLIQNLSFPCTTFSLM